MKKSLRRNAVFPGERGDQEDVVSVSAHQKLSDVSCSKSPGCQHFIPALVSLSVYKKKKEKKDYFLFASKRWRNNIYSVLLEATTGIRLFLLVKKQPLSKLERVIGSYFFITAKAETSATAFVVFLL